MKYFYSISCVLILLLVVLFWGRSESNQEAPKNAPVEADAGTQKASIQKEKVDLTAPFDRTFQDSLPLQIQTILGFTDERSDYSARMKAIGQLSRNLTEEEITALRQFLWQPYEAESKLSLRGFNAIKNDVLAALINQEQPVIGLGLQLAEMFRDRTLDSVWRDYSVQFMATLYQVRWQPETGGDHPEQVVLREAYEDALRDVESTCAGTALIGMEMLAKKYPEFQEMDLSHKALIIAKQSSASEASRIAAVLMCGRFKNEKVREEVRMLAQVGETVPLRLAAVNCLAEIGEEADIYTLQSMLDSEDQILQKAVARAIDRLKP